MKITLETSGGFAYLPSISKPVVIDTTQVDPHIATQLEVLVRESRFFEQPALADAPATGAADYQTYVITVQDGSREHSVERNDPITDANIGRLVSQLQAIAGPSQP